MVKAKYHRQLRPGCDCTYCSRKQAEWDRAKSRVAKRVAEKCIPLKLEEYKPKEYKINPQSYPTAGTALPDLSRRCPLCDGPISKGAKRCQSCAHQNSDMHILYRFFSVDGSLLYIGITNSLWTRCRNHEQTQPWWKEVTLATMEHYESRIELSTAEAEAIKKESPRYNITYNNRKFGG